MKTFIFGIGGTGSRVIRSLTMLLASGVKIDNAKKIIPIIIDLDMENGDTLRTVDSLDKYKKIRDEAYGPNSEVQNGFFAANLCMLKTLRTESNKDLNVGESFHFQFDSISSTFEEYLKFSDLDPADQDFLRLLYDDSDANSPHTELKLNLKVGFKGNPNIGSVVFNELKNSREFKFFENSFNQGDRIFIVSSIFGGTGSSGFPMLLKLLRQSENRQLGEAHIGALTVMPYFNVEDDAKSAISSRRFISKTKSALSYYEKAMNHDTDGKRTGLDALYYLYDKPGAPYPNHEGGKSQQNDAHLIEVLASLGIIHFMNLRDDNFNNKTRYMEFGIREVQTADGYSAAPSVCEIKHFFPATHQTAWKPLTLLTYFAKLQLDFLPDKLTESFAKEMDLPGNFHAAEFYQALTTFFREHYLVWLKELSKNDRSFRPFAFSENGKSENEAFSDFNALVKGQSIDASFFDKGLSDNYFITTLGKIEHELHNSLHDPRKRFMEVMNRVTEKAFAEKLKMLPTMQ